MINFNKGDLVHIPAEVYLFQSNPCANLPRFNQNWKTTRKTDSPQLGIFLKYANEKSIVVVLNDGEWVIDSRYVYPAETENVSRIGTNKIQL